MAITAERMTFGKCRRCSAIVRGEQRVLCICARCFERVYRNPCERGEPRPLDLEARIRYYRQRAAKGLPLFDPPFSEDVA